MGLRRFLAGRAVAGAHVLLVEVPDHWLLRVRAEQQVRNRGWQPAVSPADADVLLVCGTPGPQLAELVDRIWDQLPGPRTRVQVDSPDGVEEALDRARVELLDTDAQVADSRRRASVPDVEGGHGGHEGMDHGGHEGMDHGDMDMAPGGIALAEGGEDRDGLEMDLLHVRLGPVLPAWPPGLVLRCALQGDVITSAQAETVDGEEDARRPPRDMDAWQGLAFGCDHAAALLTLAGWEHGAALARVARDLFLAAETDGASADRAREAWESLRRRARRSWSLRWSLRGLATLEAERLARFHLPEDYAGDAHDRLLRLLDGVAALANNPADVSDRAAWAGEEALEHLVTGLDLATARLTVASLAPVPAGLARSERELPRA